MVETLEDILKKEEVKNVAKIQLFLTGEQAQRLLKIAQRRIKNSAWVIKNIHRYPEERRERIKARAVDSAKFWEEIAIKIESQLK